MRRKALLRETFEKVSHLLANHEPQPAEYLDVEQIILAKGSLITPERQAFAHRICGLFPRARVREQPNTPGNMVAVSGRDVIGRREKGKRTLVLGELKSAVRCREGEPGIREEYWFFSTHANCHYGCRYCYVGAARTVWFSPAIRIHVNLEEIIQQIDEAAFAQGDVTGFYQGRLQDALALDPLTGYSKVLVPFFSKHRFARQILLTKSTSVDNLLHLNHGGKTILCWSLIPPDIAQLLECDVPSVESRIHAMKRCAEKGYPVRARIQPVFPKKEWRRAYAEFVKYLVSEVRLDRLAFGGVYTNGRVRYLTKRLLPEYYGAFKGICKGNSDEEVYSRPWCEKYYGDSVYAAVSARPRIDIGPCHIL